MFRLPLALLFCGLASATLETATLTTCNIGVGLSPWRLNSDWDSRLDTNAIECADGQLPTTRGITVVNPLTEFAINLRSLGRGLTRQGFVFDPLRFTPNIIQLVGVCMTDTRPTGSVQLTAMNAVPYLLDACGGTTQSTTGSPFFQQRTDDGAVAGAAPAGLRQGWQIRNPPSAGFVDGGVALGVIVGCNFFWTCGVVGTSCFVITSAWADSAGLAPFTAWSPDAAPTTACANSNGPTSTIPEWTGSTEAQLYGGRTTILQSYTEVQLQSQLTTPVDATQRGIVWFAHFMPGEASALAFQLGCAAGVNEDTTKFATFSFISTGAAPLANGEDLTLDANGELNANSLPDTVDSTILLTITCQNEATDTPTPPLYPQPPAPSPGAAPAPLTPGSAFSSSVIIAMCSSLCLDPAWQAAVCLAVTNRCLLQGNVGCNCEVTCTLDVSCEEPLSTTSVTPGRRGLKQATLTYYKAVIIATTKIVETALFLAQGVRSGQLSPPINAFSNIRIVSFNGVNQATEVPYAAPSGAVPIVSWPHVQAPWTGTTEVYGTCRDAGCVATCSNVVIQKVSDFAPGADITCSCKTCQANLALTQYYFVTLACANADDQAAADACALLVMQDVVCWALSQGGLLLEDAQAIAGGSWVYRPASIGTPVPAAVRLDGPRTCPDSSSSNKGLLGLLGLLGIIPLLLCCLLLLLCLIRRKKREGDVHFATFDPQAANLSAATMPMPTMPAGPSVMCGTGLPMGSPLGHGHGLPLGM